jgi:Nif-specific regulatory protein
MSDSAILEGIQRGESGQELLPTLIQIAQTEPTHDDYFASALKAINAHFHADATAVIRGTKGQWRTMARSGSEINASNLPTDLLADALDRDASRQHDLWSATPLKSSKTGLLLLQLSGSNESPSVKEIESAAAALSLVSGLKRSQLESKNEVERLEALLEMTSQWNQSKNTDQLLEQMAITATRLLASERATIFLLDSTQQTLIGKPALGVESGELRIPATAGLVGQVVKSGTAQRVDDDVSDEQQMVHREVDTQLGFETRNLLCVPLIDKSGKTIGAFELINRLKGNFTSSDEAALTQLAAHAVIAIDKTRHVEQLVTSKRNVAEVAAEKVHLIGDCLEIQNLKKTVAKVAGTDLAVLITGENGTGKEVVAQMIHYLSDRRDEVLVAVNCAAISETLLESELFGHEKGAFTDAHQAREGKFELADGGTLFLDEIGDMSPGGQSKLLRVLEEKVVVRVGGSTPIPTSARIIAATNQQLPDLVSENKFRQDLYFRLNVVTIELPALRDRGDDVLLLADHFLKEFCRAAKRKTPNISAAARKRLVAHSWPGNIRELRNLMERLAYLSEGDSIGADDLDFVNAPSSQESAIAMDQPLAEATKEFQVDYIQRHIKRCQGNMTDAAARMGLHRSNLYRKMRQLGMNDEDENE